MSVAIHHHAIEANGISLHYALAGSGPLMVFLHGFPQNWYAFRHQLAEFDRDHLAVAPDLRGCNLSGKPDGLWNYGPLPAAADVRELVRHLGYERFTLVGHDWGAATAWTFAFEHPEMLERLVILSTAHPALFDRALRGDPEQQKASQYLLALRRRDSAERVRHDDFAALRATFAPFAFFSPADRKAYHDAWSQPGSLEGMLAWYQREALGPASGQRPARGDYAPEAVTQVVEVPTLVIYGDADAYTRPASHQGLAEFAPNARFHVVEGASHWLCDEQPATVNRLIREFASTSAAQAA
jgi:pimeloyl-ACP methyl ester carboxylesterase